MHAVPSQPLSPPVGAMHGSHAWPQLSGDALLTQASSHRCASAAQEQSPPAQVASVGHSSSVQQSPSGMHAPSQGFVPELQAQLPSTQLEPVPQSWLAQHWVAQPGAIPVVVTLGLGAVVLAVGASVVVPIGVVTVELEVAAGSPPLLLVASGLVPLGSVAPELELGASSPLDSSSRWSVASSSVSVESSSDLDVDASSPFLSPLWDSFVGWNSARGPSHATKHSAESQIAKAELEHRTDIGVGYQKPAERARAKHESVPRLRTPGSLRRGMVKRF